MAHCPGCTCANSPDTETHGPEGPAGLPGQYRAHLSLSSGVFLGSFIASYREKKKTKTHMVRCHEGLAMSLGHAAMAVRRTVSWDMAAWAAFIHGLQHGHFPPKCIVCYRPQARTPSLETMFLLVSVVYRPWHLGLGIIGPHGHLEKTHEWHSLGTLLLEKDTKSLLRP